MMSKNSHIEAMELFPLGRLLTVEEVAQILRIAVPTIYTWVSEMKIPFTKFGEGKSALRFNPWILNNWVIENSITPSSKSQQTDNLNDHVELNQARVETMEKFNLYVNEIK